MDALAILAGKVLSEGQANRDEITALKAEIETLKNSGGAASAADLQRWTDKLDAIASNTSALDQLNPDAPQPGV